MANEHKSLTREALTGKHVLITGTTGFVGKVLLEKLMRDIPGIGGIYLLIRSNKKYPNARERFLHEIACSSIFDSLKLGDPIFFEEFCAKRVHCITGEVTEPLFGMGEMDFKTLAGKIDLVINSAASVNFREELDQALMVNSLSLNHLMSFSRAAGEIPIVQVSTCYVNGFNRGDMREEVVVPARQWIPRHESGYFLVDDIISQLQRKISRVRQKYAADSDILKKKLIDLGIKESNRYGWNDTYTFTKWIGEQLLLKGMTGKTLTILRPSIVESTLRSPSPGWIEGVKVADALILAYAREKVAVFPGRSSGVIDVIPADLVANSIILSAAEAMLQPPGRHRIYQCCSGGSKPIKLGDFIRHLQQESQENWERYDRLFYRRPQRPFITVNKGLFHGLMNCIRYPLKGIGAVRRLVGVKTPFKTLENIETAMNLSVIFSFYTAPRYVFHNEKLMQLAARMGEKDRALFPVDARAIDWKHYLREVHLGGLQKYALKPRKLYQLSTEKMRRKNKAA